MKRLFVVLLVVSLGFGMGGCGLFTGPDNYASYKEMYQSFTESKTARSNQIANMPCPTESVAAAWCNSTKMMGMVVLSLEQFTITAPKTGYDVLLKLTDSVVPVAGFYTMWKLGLAGIEGAGNQFNGGYNTFNNAFNHTNPQNYSLGGGSPSFYNTGTSPPADPVIVEPFVVTP